MHYIDEGNGQTLLFVHGTPSWSFDFRKVIFDLRGDFRCVAVDHLGFGLSDKPEHYDYSTHRHSATLEHFVLQKELHDITLVVHDFGGPIGMQFAIRHPDRVRQLVILNSWLWDSRTDPDFIRLSRVLRSPLLPWLYRHLNFSPRFVLPASFGEHRPSRHILRHYVRPFADRTQRNGTIAFARSLLNDHEWFQTLWDTRGVIADRPTLLVWGMNDPVIGPRHLERFVSGFPNSTAVRLQGCGHFPQEEEPEAVARGIREFLRGSS